MNREIKFRAKDVNTGDWRYGYLVLHETQEHGVIIVHGDKEHPYEILYDEWDIDPKTAGQFTGLKDKDGKEIYTDDVVKDSYYRDNGWNDWKVESKGYVKFINGAFCLVDIEDLDSEQMYDILYKRMYPPDTKAVGSIEIIGNKFDNPELLEKQP